MMQQLLLPSLLSKQTQNDHAPERSSRDLFFLLVTCLLVQLLARQHHAGMGSLSHLVWFPCRFFPSSSSPLRIFLEWRQGSLARQGNRLIVGKWMTIAACRSRYLAHVCVCVCVYMRLHWVTYFTRRKMKMMTKRHLHARSANPQVNSISVCIRVCVCVEELSFFLSLAHSILRMCFLRWLHGQRRSSLADSRRTPQSMTWENTSSNTEK